MTNNHEQIPLLAKLRVYYFCDKCRARIDLGPFYEAMDKVVEAGTEDGKLICGMCRKNKGTLCVK